jgi:hypothetical protein
MDLEDYEFDDTTSTPRRSSNYSAFPQRRPCWGGVSVPRAVEYKAFGAVLFKGAAESMAKMYGGGEIPTSPPHFLEYLQLGTEADIATYLEEQVRIDHAKNVPTPPDQISRAFPNWIVLRKSLYTKKTFFMDQEIFLQVNYRHSPGHYVHGHVLSYIPAFCVNAIKLYIHPV